MGLSQPHLLGIEPLSVDDINHILEVADNYANQLDKGNFQSDILKGKIILTLFFENSTRTRTSFEIAARRLGAEVVHWDVSTSSLAKGENFNDTIKNLSAMQPDAIIVRHSEFGAPHTIATMVDCPVINAGDSWNEHPTQALLDALTIKRRLGKLEGLNIAICGDIAHSRVAGSNMRSLTKLGANVRIVAPPALMPEKFPVEGIEKFDNLEEGIKDCDVIMMLRNQMERMQSGLISSEAEFFENYGLTKDKMRNAKDNVIIMHPGPMNRGVEIADDVADNKDHSVILEQVKNGIPTRMAVLDILIGGK